MSYDTRQVSDAMIEAGAKALGEYGFSHLNDEEFAIIYLAMKAADQPTDVERAIDEVIQRARECEAAASLGWGQAGAKGRLDKARRDLNAAIAALDSLEGEE